VRCWGMRVQLSVGFVSVPVFLILRALQKHRERFDGLKHMHSAAADIESPTDVELASPDSSPSDVQPAAAEQSPADRPSAESDRLPLPTTPSDAVDYAVPSQSK
jgi:hypothetical protein